MHHKLKMVNRWSLLLNFIGIVSLIYMITTLFIKDREVPVSCLIGHAIVFRGAYADVSPDYITWTIILAKLFGFMTTICFMVLGTYIVYYKAVIKVETMMKVKGISFYLMIIFSVIGLGDAVTSIMCSILVTETPLPA